MPVFHFQRSVLHYVRTGTGPRILLAFHGFGQHAGHWQPLARILAADYTVYALDLFYHGGSTWPHRAQPLGKAHWRQMLAAFLAQEGIASFGVAGFSMGGKFALATAEAFPDRLTELILIAPDGVKTSFWYSLATYPVWARGLFRRVVTRPRLFDGLLRTAHRLRLVDKGVLKFAANQMNTRAKRYQVYFSWMVFRQFSFEMAHIAALLNRHRIPLRMFLGRHDRLVTRPNMERLLGRVPGHQLVVLETGHNHLIQAVADHYARQRTPAPPPDPTVS